MTGLSPGELPQVDDKGVVDAPSPDLHVLTDLFDIGPSGPLATQAHITIALRAPAPPGTVVVASTRDGDGPWSYLPATLSADGRSASFDTPHFSSFAVLGYDLGQAVETFKRDFLDEATNGATQTDVARPTCADEAGARGDGYSVDSSSTDTVYWCLGRENGGRVLKVTDHRRYPLQVRHRGLPIVAQGATDKLSAATLSRIASGPYAIIAPGGTATFSADLDPGRDASVVTEFDGAGQSLYALQTGVETLFSILDRFGFRPDRRDLIKVVSDVLSVRSCADALGKGPGAVISGCLADGPTLEKGFGAAGVLLLPIMTAGALFSFVRSDVNAVVDLATQRDRYTVTVRRAAPPVDLGVFAGHWTGHTRDLTVSASGAVHEHVDDGCCMPALDLDLQLSAPKATGPGRFTATATVVAVNLNSLDARPPLHPGQTGTVSLDGGIITDDLDGIFYCNEAEDAKGSCGL